MDECRKEFENSFSADDQNGLDLFSRDCAEKYCWSYVQERWIGWQAAWNRRADSAALAEQNRELRKALQTIICESINAEYVAEAALALPDLSTEPLERFMENQRTRIADKLSELCYDDAAEVVRRMGGE